jgi:hypothetical protein
MNAKRRKEIEKALDILRAARDEEQEAYDNLPEPIQYSEAGDKYSDAIEALEEVCDKLDELVAN